MFLFVEMNSNLTSGLLCSYSQLTITESDLEFIGSRTNVLNLAFFFSSQDKLYVHYLIYSGNVF